MKQEQQHKDLMRRAVRHLLVTDDDVMNEAERIVGHTLRRENQGDEGCLTVTEIARELDMEARDLNSFLRDMGIQRWKQGQYRLTPQYEGRGLTHDRLFIYYSTKDGKKKRQTYLVWTPKGLEFIRKLIKGKGKEFKNNKSNMKKKNQKKSNLGRLVLTCTDWNDLHQQLQDDTELLGKMMSGVIDRHCNWRSPYDQEVITNVCTSILACVTELAERDCVNMRDNVVEKYDAWLELYRSKISKG